MNEPEKLLSVDQAAGTIVAPDGTVATRPTVMFSQSEAELLRRYKKFLQKYHLREALYCNECWDGNRSDGCEAYVMPDKIGVICRCRLRLYFGSTV